MFRLYVDSSTGVDIEPEYDFKDPRSHIESRHRSKSGREYVYKWGSYKKFEFTVMYVDSSFMCTVNSWRGANTALRFKSTSDAAVYSVRISNNEDPITERIMPYSDLFQGTIELSTY